MEQTEEGDAFLEQE
uniref:Uncharacterized protein n=2 Tax=Anguilla anguilla TaxID=7936 RepID=A0A0E9QUA3_ANGAN